MLLSSYLFIELSRYKMSLLKPKVPCSRPWFNNPSAHHQALEFSHIQILAAGPLHSDPTWGVSKQDIPVQKPMAPFTPLSCETSIAGKVSTFIEYPHSF